MELKDQGSLKTEGVVEIDHCKEVLEINWVRCIVSRLPSSPCGVMVALSICKLVGLGVEF